MGSFLTANQQLNDQTYVLGFNSRTGTAGRITDDKKYPLQKPVKNSFETWIPEAVPYAFVNFKQFRIENPNTKQYFSMKGLQHSADSALWTNIYDGIFYIRDMYPCALGVKKDIPIN